MVKFLSYLLHGKNLIPNLKTKYCRCFCVGELGQLWQLLHVKNGVKHFLIIFCFAVLVLTKSWSCKIIQMEMQAITQPRTLQLEVAQISHSQKARQNRKWGSHNWLKTYRTYDVKLLMHILNYLDYFPKKCKQTWRGLALSQFFVSST